MFPAHILTNRHRSNTSCSISFGILARVRPHLQFKVSVVKITQKAMTQRSNFHPRLMSILPLCFADGTVPADDLVCGSPRPGGQAKLKAISKASKGLAWRNLEPSCDLDNRLHSACAFTVNSALSDLGPSTSPSLTILIEPRQGPAEDCRPTFSDQAAHESLALVRSS